MRATAPYAGNRTSALWLATQGTSSLGVQRPAETDSSNGGWFMQDLSILLLYSDESLAHVLGLLTMNSWALRPLLLHHHHP